MSHELVPVIDPERPTTVMYQGWVVSVATRDAYHLWRKSEFKRAIMDAHPDRGGSGRKVQFLIAKYRQWRRGERIRYGKLGLNPPGTRRSGEPVQIARPWRKAVAT